MSDERHDIAQMRHRLGQPARFESRHQLWRVVRPRPTLPHPHEGEIFSAP